MPLVHRAGDEAQVNFFEVTVLIDGKREKKWMFLMRLMYSGRDFVWLYERCDQVSFLDGHVRAFAAVGCFQHRCGQSDQQVKKLFSFLNAPLNMRRTGPGRDLPFHRPDVVARLVRPDVLEFDSLAAENRAILAGQKVFDRPATF